MWRTKLIEWWRGIFLFDVNRRQKYAWVRRILICWSDGVTVGFYPDYEHCQFEVTLWTGKERR